MRRLRCWDQSHKGWVVSSQGISKVKAQDLLSLMPELDLQLRLTQSLPPEVLTPQPSPGDGTPQAYQQSPPRSRDSNSSPDEPSLEDKEEEQWGQLEREPITGQCLDSTDQSEFTLEPHLLGKLLEQRFSFRPQRGWEDCNVKRPTSPRNREEWRREKMLGLARHYKPSP